MVLYGTQNLEQDKQAYDLLAIAVEEQWGLPALPALGREENGKPFFPGSADHCFNLSHSGTLALCGLDDAPLGVDIQIVKQWRPGLPARVCCPAELDWLEQQPSRELAFVMLWALKEAKVKQSGLGLRTNIREIRVPLPRSWSRPVFLDGLWFRVIPGGRWAAAVCGLTPPPAEIHWKNLISSAAP